MTIQCKIQFTDKKISYYGTIQNEITKQNLRPYSKRFLIRVIYKFHCGLCYQNYLGESIRHKIVRSGELIGILTCTHKKVCPSKNCDFCDHHLYF